ncbi:MAG: transporter substrate-binding domain-containing protein [Aquabacterium sp.]|uniref:substrate-binding periplasmic protein n=1 Tax=Aquabacterium sp. TaxID=1872578 RepID=UPI0025B9F145|nr:transporter substrate-binding domain-containing protein [Aquabacterium sp.]MBI3382815.1 transporter substrate-binding domain-containing protein [Aquabacterium sp.]
MAGLSRDGRLAACLLALIGFTPMSSAQALPSKTAPNPAPAHFVACSLPLAPHTMPDARGKPSGHATEILQAVALRLGWALDIRYMPWVRVVDQAKRGDCDLVYTVLKRADYETFLVFPQEPVQMRANVLVVLKGRGIQYDGNLEAFMRQHSVGLYRDKAVDERFEVLRRAPWAHVDEASDARLNLMKLLAGRFDAAIENEMTAVHELRELGHLDDVVLLAPPLNRTLAYVAFPKAGRLAGQSGDFDRAMKAFKQTQDYRELWDAYVRGMPTRYR